MKFRYDFAEKLDLSRFKKQALHYINVGRESTFELYVNDFKINVEIATFDGQDAHIASLYFEEIKRDLDGEIISTNIITPMIDLRFKDIENIKHIFDESNYKSHFNYKSTTFLVDHICFIIKLLNKINSLKAFI